MTSSIRHSQSAVRHSPLSGKRILVTRPRAQADDLGNKLAALGAEPIPFPTIEIAPMDDYSALDESIQNLETYHWIIFTSVNGVSAFWSRLDLAGIGDPPGLIQRIAAIGPATAQALKRRGVGATFIPDEYVAEAIVAGIGDVRGKWILLPRADIAREALAVELANRGAVVHEIAAYRTLPAAPDPLGLAELQRGVDAITFTSSSTVRNFVALAGQFDKLPNQPAIACIGPITAQTVREVGWPVDVIATEYTMAGLVAALATHFASTELT
jgi:uroporphyrinogen-III synthase